MKIILAIVALSFSLMSAASAVTWNVVSVSLVLKQGNAAGNVVTTVLSTRKYLDFVAATTSTPKTDLFVGLREDTGEVAVVKRSTETVLYRIVSGLGSAGLAANSTGTLRISALPATVSSLNTDFSGFIYETQTRNSSGAVRGVNRLCIGGSGNQVIKGSVVTTGRKIVL